MKADATVKTWEKTRLQNLVRHKSGRYYARLFLNGKEIWKSLKTSHFSVAEAKLAEVQKEHKKRRAKDVDPANAKMTFAQAATLHMQRLEERVTIKKRTRKYWKETLDAMLKDWPELAGMEVRRITPKACRDWASRYAKTASANRYNNSISLLRHVIDVAIESGVVYANPATGLERKTIRGKQLELPTRSKFVEFIAEMRAVHSRNTQNCADLAQGLAFTGCRISEAAQIEWRDLDFSAGEILVKGDPEEATKNGEIRRVPMIPQAKELFEKMRKGRTEEPSSAKVFLVHECQKAMDRAAKKIRMARITHHDLRHFFATVSIESGVDIPTVSRWLGHKDGGALAMRTYGHLRREHSVAQAQKVSFAPIPEKAEAQAA
jgi:integrase